MRLSKRDRTVLDTLLPSKVHANLPFGIFDTGFDAFYEEFSRTANYRMRLGFRIAVFAAAWLSPMLVWRLPPITLHNRIIRERALAKMAGSGLYSLRQLITILKVVSCFGYGADTAVRDALGFPLQHDDPRVLTGKKEKILL